MKRILIVTLLLCGVLLTACGNAKSIAVIGGADGPTSIIVAGRGGKTLHNPILGDKWGITLSCDKVTPKGLRLKIEQFGGNPSGELQTGAAYTLETAVGDEWQPLETKTGEPLVWNSLAYRIKKNDITEMNIDWEYGYGELKHGYYRLRKEIMDFRESGDYDTETYEVYFTIE